MADLIDRRAVLKEMPHALWGKEWDEALAKAIIESMPTIDPVKHGKWIAAKYCDGTVRTECSVCGYGRGLPPVRNYCPNCGAKME